MESLAKLKNCPVPPRKMRILADHVRGKRVDEALNILKFHQKKMYAKHLEKLLLSGIANWQEKNEGEVLEEHELYIKTIQVDEGRTLKRIRPAAMGRANRIRKRSNHITVKIDSLNQEKEEGYEEEVTEEESAEEEQTEENNTNNEA